MSSDIDINDDLSVSVSVNSLRIKSYEKYVYFDMTDISDRQAIKNLIEVLQHQLEVHEDK